MPMAPNTMDIAQDGEADRMLTSAQGRAETQPPVVPTMVPEAHATEQGPTQIAEAGTQPPGSVGQTEGVGSIHKSPAPTRSSRRRGERRRGLRPGKG